MIRVARPQVTPEVRTALERPVLRTAETELQRARSYYAQVPPPTKAYDFERYRDWVVCQALDELFHEKCAYCESSYRAVDSRDVEHFRPKGGVREAPDHPGYWWLAASWENLLPSCPPCNRRRRQLAFDPGMTLEEFELARLREPDEISGKGGSFPMRDQVWVRREDDDTSIEDPLLINPTDPEYHLEHHLEWVFEWERSSRLWRAQKVIAVLRPRRANGVDDPYGKASIAVYGLNRAGLIRERMALIQVMQVTCQHVIDVLSDLIGVENPAEVAMLKRRLVTYKADLLSFTRPEKPYASMCQGFVSEFETQLGLLNRPPG